MAGIQSEIISNMLLFKNTGGITMKTIYKFILKSTDEQTLELPLGSKILSAKEQRDEIVLYALVNPDEEIKVTYSILAYGTGQNIDVKVSGYEFLDTVLLNSGSLVFHFFYKRIS